VVVVVVVVVAVPQQFSTIFLMPHLAWLLL
jgi:hypothetical protein